MKEIATIVLSANQPNNLLEILPVTLEASRKPLCQSKLTYAPVDIDLHKEELNRLVRLVSDHHNFSQEDYEEALETALANFDSAMICFTSLARRII